MSGRFGPVDSFDSRYNTGWRHWVLVFGFAQWQFIRQAFGGSWEFCYIEPCQNCSWFPVTRVESVEEPGMMEHYGPPDPAALYTPFRWLFIGVWIWATMQKLLSWLGG